MHPEKPSLNSAFQSLDDLATEIKQGGTDQSMVAELQRWLCVFAREHLADICAKLMAAMDEHAAVESLPTQSRGLFGGRKDAAATGESTQDDGSAAYFLLNTLRRVLIAASEGHNLSSSSPGLALRSVPEGLLAFCFARLSLAHPAPLRHVAGACLGLLSRAHLASAVALFAEKLGDKKYLNSDAGQREYVSFERAAAHVELSVHSAEQAAASTRYLSLVASAMGSFNRTVLRAELCSSLRSMLERLMRPSRCAPLRTRASDNDLTRPLLPLALGNSIPRGSELACYLMRYTLATTTNLHADHLHARVHRITTKSGVCSARLAAGPLRSGGKRTRLRSTLQASGHVVGPATPHSAMN